jgi:thymidylate synthase
MQDVGLNWVFDLRESFPILTTKRVFWESAFAEMIGFIRGFDNAAQFREIGCNVWDANANETPAWLESPYREGKDDLGRVYGVQWRNWVNPIGYHFDQLDEIYQKLRRRVDDRRLVLEAWNPGELDLMCLPPCHYSAVFSLVENKTMLDLTVHIRSNDVGLGLPFNVTQYAFLLSLMAHITDLKPRKLHYKVVNYHIYGNHLNGLKEQIKRVPYAPTAKLVIHPEIETLRDVESFLPSEPVRDLFQVQNYEHHPAIRMPMAA